jgi:glucose-6-phosphate isomerase
MNTTPPDACPAWPHLLSHAQRLRSASLATLLQDAERTSAFSARAVGLTLDFARQRIDAGALAELLALAAQRGLTEWRDALFAGEPINSSENRAARHWALRAGAAAPAQVRAVLEQMRELCERWRSGTMSGATGRRFTRLVHLGTGGSDLGPRLVVDALAEHADPGLELRFAANVDPLDLERALRGADAQTTAFAVVSKTFTTQETSENAAAARDWLARSLPPGAALERHFIAVTANGSAARQFGAAAILPFWDWVGGRYSVWSAVGFSAMAALGASAFDEFLAGAADTDRHFREAPLAQNLPVLMALLGVWNTDFLGAATHAVLPYSTALRLLPAYLQQLEMESNGKSVDREGRALGYASAPVVWGAEGTVGQHSFHQLLHQGSQVVPADFIVVEQAPGDARRRAILAAHAEAQATALALGRDDRAVPAHRRYPGNRPSSTLRVRRLDARHLGRLLALYEHKVFVQGVIWNVNSFDQWGVELGKELAARLLAPK